MWRVLLIALAACTQVAEAAPAPGGLEAARVRLVVDALPLLATIDGPTPVVVRGELRGRRAAELVTLARAVRADVSRRFVRPVADGTYPPVTLALAPSEDGYQALAGVFDEVPSLNGFYRPDLRVAVINLARGTGNLRHELVHPLLGDDFPAIPAWLNEGIASLYGTAHRRGPRFEFLANYRLRDVRRALAAGTLPDRDQLADAGDAELYGPRGGVYYGTARLALLYLDRVGRLDALYADIRAAPARRRALLAAALDWDEVIAWSRRLRIGRVPPPPRPPPRRATIR